MTQSSLKALTGPRLGAALLLTTALAACDGPMDLDMRGRLGGPVDTSQAAVNATADRPEPDARGVISYPNYQVAVARRGDTLADVASRVGLPAEELASHNGVQTGDRLRAGEVVSLPRRVSEPSGQTGTPGGTQALEPAGNVDIATLAGNAIDSSPASGQSAEPPNRTTPKPAPSGPEPVRHQVERGETAFTIARLYNVTPRALAEWNGLDENFTLREGQYLLIPVAQEEQSAAAEPDVSEPGRGSPTPTPPSSSRPLPEESPEPRQTQTAAAPPPDAPAPDVGETTESSASEGEFAMPVSGSIIREYSKGRNDGIDIAAPAGTAVKAAAGGTVAAITTNTDDIPILVVKHPGDLLTVYTHIDGISVKKGDSVSRGQTIGKVKAGDPARMHFEVRNGFESVDPMTYLRG
ncbi:peptidoglycan DD-metalloendopeptidase family protein [Roseivivax sediminis]|uniref:Murein DD-endopeptidase MepM and murein hydrolase activator NlpD, contain LysM domain n=1 Tax=Roseivivax sediminis TaxID=936889 RepID=A0A1I1YGX9_9RHOB|nr:peptidoglycan DD-metalloendopeptidase family protein [Roseivivax sediminis]SFE18806.1 Murein DD-endopeptidase MepM and murein hydrolase activator NlpD, contain LysM domain [Roseivivax sediminis]